MGHVYADITLKNATDVGMVERGIIGEPEIRQEKVQALVDTGASTLIINEIICKKLGLEVKGERMAKLADKTAKKCKYTEPVEVHWKNRTSAIRALVLEGADEVLLGAIPLEDMDLIVDPVRRELTGAHGDEIVCLIK